jgi:hypothetical protein
MVDTVTYTTLYCMCSSGLQTGRTPGELIKLSRLVEAMVEPDVNGHGVLATECRLTIINLV